jgi:hypothetical protein
MIYSKRHRLNGVLPMNITDWAPIVLCKPDYRFIDSEHVSVAAKLDALGIDPKFLDPNLNEFSMCNFERELAELQEDYNFFFGDDDEEQT